MLVAPTVVAPITPWSQSIRVKFQVTGSVVAIFADGLKIGGVPAISGDMFVPIDPGFALQPGQKITASQEKDGQSSGETAKTSAITVLKHPSPSDLGTIFSRAPLARCGTCLWLEGVVPGADVTVMVPPDPPITVAAEWTAVHVDIPKLADGRIVVVKQGKGPVVGPNVSLPPALPQPEGVPVAPPRITEPLYECDGVLELTDVRAGAKLTVDHDGDVTDFCFGAIRGTFWLGRRLALGDRVIVKQAFPGCELESLETNFYVTESVPPPPWFPYPVCAGDRDVEVGGLRVGAAVRLLIGRGTNTVLEAEAGEPPHRFNLPPLGNQKWLGVQQSLCPGDGLWSEAAWTALVAVGSLDSPRIEQPVHECGQAVGVAGLSAGSRVYVISSLWHGSIGDALALGDAFTDVPLQFKLIAGDTLSLEVVRCGQLRALPDVALVKPAPSELSSPLISDPLDDTGGTITVDGLVPGAFCDVEEVAEPTQNQGVFLVSHPVTRARVSIPVPPLRPGRFIRCRQRLCGRVSRPSVTVKTGDRPLEYEPLSADRIVALTGIRGHGTKPARYDTTQVGLIGTDLGIPVVHGGRLYFFFGDCDGDDDDDNVMDADADPIASTTDPPDWPGGPYLSFVTGSRGLFHRLHVAGLPQLGNFEVPTGAFSYHGRLYVFVAREKLLVDPVQKMNTSHLAVTRQPGGVDETLELVCDVASTLPKNPPAPAGRWLVHVAPTVVRCEDWPGLPADTGDGLVMFGTELYHASNLFLAFSQLAYSSPSVPLGPWGPYTNVPPPIPKPSTWLYFVAGAPQTADHPANWRPTSALPSTGPTPLLPGVGALGEVSAGWHPLLRRWVTIHPGFGGTIEVQTARAPWGPWSAVKIIFDGVNPANQASADNLQPGHQFMNLWDDSADRNTVVYAPYLIPAWTRFDRSTRVATLYYTLSTEHPPYNVQLMSARLVFS